MPSSSARCSQFPRAQDKVQFYVTLRDLRDELKALKANNGIPKALPSGSTTSEGQGTEKPPVETTTGSTNSSTSSTSSSSSSVPTGMEEKVKIKEEKTDSESYKICQSKCPEVPCTSSSVQSVPVKSEPLESKDYITLQPMKPMDNSFLHNSISSFADGYPVKQEPIDGVPYGCPGNSFLPTIKQELRPGRRGNFSGPNSHQEWPTVDLGNFIDDIPPIASNAAVPVSEEDYVVQESTSSQSQYTKASF